MKVVNPFLTRVSLHWPVYQGPSLSTGCSQTAVNLMPNLFELGEGNPLDLPFLVQQSPMLVARYLSYPAGLPHDSHGLFEFLVVGRWPVMGDREVGNFTLGSIHADVVQYPEAGSDHQGHQQQDRNEPQGLRIRELIGVVISHTENTGGVSASWPIFLAPSSLWQQPLSGRKGLSTGFVQSLQVAAAYISRASAPLSIDRGRGTIPVMKG